MKQVMAAMKDLQTTAERAAKVASTVAINAQVLREKATTAQQAVDLTIIYETAAKQMAIAEKGSVGAQLGSILKGKGLKVADVVAKCTFRDDRSSHSI